MGRTEEYTVATWLRTWYELYAKPNIRTATANRYELIIERYTIPRIGSIKLKKLTTRHLQKLYKELLEDGRIHVGKGEAKGLSTTTVRLVSIPQTAVDLLIQEHDKHPDSPYLFPSPITGELYHPDSVVNLHKKILKDAGLPHIRFHEGKHS